MADLEVILRGAAPTTPVDVRRSRCVRCNTNSVCETGAENLHSRKQKHGEYLCYSYAPMRIGAFLKLINVYIWIGILFCSFHLGATANNTTDVVNMTAITESTTILFSTTELPEITTDLMTTVETSSVPGWIYGIAAVGGLVVIAGIVLIVFYARKKCKCCSRPPSPVNKDFTSSVKGDFAIGMETTEPAIDDPIYQNTTIGAQPQDNPVFDPSTPEDLPVLPVPSPPVKGASNLSLDNRPPMGLPSPFRLPQPSPGPALSSPTEDFPDRPPPAVPHGSKMDAGDRFVDARLPGKPEKTKGKKDIKQKAPQRFIDPNEKIREKIPMAKKSKSSSLDACKPVNAAPAIFDFSGIPPGLGTGDDFGGTYEDMSPVNHSPLRRPSPRQPDNGDFGDVYEEMAGVEVDYDDEYEIVDPNAPRQRQVGQARRPNVDQRQMVLPPVKSQGDDFGGEYEVVSRNDHRVGGLNIDNRPQVPIPEEEDFGGEYENPDQRRVLNKKKKPPLAKPKTARKPSNIPKDADFGQEYGNTGPGKSFAASAPHRHPPSLPSSSLLPDTLRSLPEGDEQMFPPPPSEQYPPALASGDQDVGDIYDDTQVTKPSFTQKPITQKPRVSPKPSSGGGSSLTLPHSPAKQPLPLESRSSASLPAGTELIEENVYENFQAPPDTKEKITRHYHNLPAPERNQEQINSSGYSFFSERPRQY